MVNPQPPQPPPQPTPAVGIARGSGIRWKFVLIIAAVGAFLVIGLLYGLSSLAKVNLSSTFGVPQDFPVYPAASLVGVRETMGTGGTRVDASWEANAPLDIVTAFYSQRLNQPPWKINRTNPVDGTWEFESTDGKTRGLIRLSGHGQQTRVDVSLQK